MRPNLDMKVATPMTAATRTPGRISEDLAHYYRQEGLAENSWHIGPEHPALELAALEVLEPMASRHVVEVGFQAGGFAVPIISALHHDPKFRYVGVDNLAYKNAVRPEALVGFLQSKGISSCYEFVQGNSTEFLKTLVPASVDLVLVDHFKPMYERDLLILCRRGVVKPTGAILLHDVHAGAARAWRNCQHIVRTFRLAVDLRSDVPAGLAILRPRSVVLPGALTAVRSFVIASSRAAIGDTILQTRTAIGRRLRRLGLRK